MSSRYKKEYFIILIFVAVNLVLHLIADRNAGFHGDELYYIDSGRHPALGYMDFPPLIGWLAWFQNLFHSTSLSLNHLFVFTASSLIFVFVGLTVLRAGGKWSAVTIALCCILFAPGFAATHSLFLPDVFEQLFSVILFYALVSYCKKPDNKYLILSGISAAFGFLTKYSIGFPICGLLLSVVISQPKLLKNKILWLSILLFLLFISPNIYWQVNNHLPFIKHFSQLYNTQLDQLSRLAEIKSLLLFLNPVTSVVWLVGLAIFPFAARFKEYRLAGLTLSFTFLLILAAAGKSYYFYPVILGALPLGAVFLEQLLSRRKWILISYLSVIGLTGIIFLPRGMTILPLNTYLKVYKLQKNSDGRIPLPLENFYSKDQWNKLLNVVDSTFRNLPAGEQKMTLIWGRHYSQAGIINLFRREYGLPRAFSFHGSCYTWVPDFSKKITVIGISEANLGKQFWLQYFEDVHETGDIENPYANNLHWYRQRVFICRKPKYDSAGLKNLFRNQIF